MSRPTYFRGAILSVGVLAGLAVPSAAFAVNSTAVALTTDNKISTFETGFPTEATTPVAVTDSAGAALTDKLVAIDVRPQNGALYALGYTFTAAAGSTPASGTLQLYSLSSRTGVATKIGGTFAASTVTGATLTADTQFGFDFNPTVDRIRVVSDAGQNGRLNPNTGAYTADTAIPADTKIDGAAYTNDQQNAAVTTLYTLSGAGDKLYLQTPPNDGTQTAPKEVKVNGTAVDFSAVGGFDITPGVNVGVNNSAPPAGSAGFIATNAGGKASLSVIDLNTGAAAPVGLIGNGTTPVQGLAIQQDAVTGGAPSVSISGATSADLRLLRFNTGDPVGGKSVPVTGVAAADVPVAVDWRPQTGQLLLLAINSATDTATLYNVDPQAPLNSASPTSPATAGDAVATPIGSGASFQDAAGTAVPLPSPATTSYDIDFNPTVDRVRVVASNGLNFRMNPNTGAAVDGDLGGAAGSIANTNTDGNQNAAVDTTGKDVSGTAYTNAFGQRLPVAPSTTAIGTTTQYGLSAGKDQLLIQNPPNAGTQTAPLGIKVNGAAFDFSAVRGFDISPNVRSGASASAATGSGLAVLATTTTPGGLYSIDLSSGAATLKGVIPGTPTSIAVGDTAPANKDRTPPVVVTPPSTGGGGTTTPTTPTTPTKPTTPTTTKRINLRKVNAKGKRSGRKFTTTGSLSFRTSYSAAEKRRLCGAKGTVSVLIRAGKRTISNRRVTVKSNCTFSVATRFSSTRRYRTRSSLSFTVKYNGNAFILPRSASKFSVRTR